MPDLPITMISFAYPEASLEARAGVARSLGDLNTALERVAAAGHEAFVMGTCLRFDVMIPGPAERLDDVARLLFDGQIPVGGRRREGNDALTYLYRVAAGLESPIKGEDDVLVQFRQAFEGAKAAAAIHSPMIVRSLEGAIASGRKARSVMTGAGHRTLAGVAAVQVDGAASVAVFGAGTMGRAVVGAIGGSNVTVVVRRPEQVQIPGAKVVGMEQAVDLLASVEAVVVATAAKGRLLSDADFASALARRSSTLTLVDLAVPRNLVPPPGTKVTYIDIDGLSDLVDDPPDVDRAEAIVESAAAEAADRIASHQSVGPLIASLLAHGERAASEVSDRFAGRFDDDQRELASQMTRAVARKILHDPVSFLRQGRHTTEQLEVLLEAFDVAP